MTRARARTSLTALLLTVAGACAARPDAAVNDPLEPLNRKIFWFNDKVDVYFLEPVARGWDFVLPGAAQRSVGNFFENLDFPIVLTNDVLQGKPRDAGVTLGRFLLNTTVGVGGLFDPAEAWGGVEGRQEDFGQTLGRWGLGGGPYLVLPLIGASNLRDTGGLAVDTPLRVYSFFVPFAASAAATATRTVNLRSLFLEEVRNSKEAALDYYVFVRDAYEQSRRALIEDTTEAVDDEDLYDVDIDLEE
jgi:phospholipid-binding lipoprotein MlaA